MNWLIWLLAGFSAGLIVGVLIDRDTVNNYMNKIRRVKFKGKGQIISDGIDMTVEELKENLKKTRKEERRKKRAQRRSGTSVKG